MIGRTISHYRIIAQLGVGGMGEVYLAHDSRLGRDLAIKIMPPEMAADPDLLRRFENEARLASALNHPNIVTIYEVGCSEGIPYIAMELVRGSTIREVLQSGPMPIGQVLGITAQIAEGLARAHEAGIVHRDLKPENVMVTQDGLVKILDFGLGKHVLSSLQNAPDTTTMELVPQATVIGSILGTVDYMSPEQAAGRAVDFRCDQFAFGSLICEMVTGVNPFRRNTAVQTLSAIIEAPPQLPAKPRLPVSLRRVTDRCLEKDPTQRFASTRALANELRLLGASVTDVDGVQIGDVPVRGWQMLLLAVGLVGMVTLVLSNRSSFLDRLGPIITVLPTESVAVAQTKLRAVLPYWTLAVLNALVLFSLGGVLLALERRRAVVQAFVAFLVLRGIVGVTATLGDGAPPAIARPAIALDAASSTLVCAALFIFVLLYPAPRRWAGRVVLGTIVVVAAVLAGIALVMPSTLGVFALGPGGTLVAVSPGLLLGERASYIGAIAVSAVVLAFEHPRVARPELRRSVLLIGIALAIFPIAVASTIVQLPQNVARTAFLAYGNHAATLVLVWGTMALVSAVMLATTELRRGDRRAAAGTLVACGITAVSGLVGAHYGAAPTTAGSVSFLLRGIWRFPLPILATYALLRHHLLGVDVRLKWTIRRGALAAIFLAAFVIVALLVQGISNARLGFLAGAVATTLLFFALAPLQRLAERLADAALPRVRDPRTVLPPRRLEAYQQAVDLVLADGILNAHKERALAALADELGISAIDALNARQRALARL